MTAVEEKVSASEQLLFGGRLREDYAWMRHNGAFLEMSIMTMVLRLPRLLALTARLAHQANARALRRVIAAEVGRGAAQAVGMVQVNHVLAALLAAGTTVDRLRDALPTLIIVCLTGVFGAVCKAVSVQGTGLLEPTVERVATEIYLEAPAKVELSAVEDAEYRKRQESARFGAASARRMIPYSTSIINALLSLIASVGVLTALHPALLPLIVLTTVPSAWASLSVARRRYQSFHAWMQHARAGRLISDLLVSNQAAAEIRVHGIGAFLLQHFHLMAEDSEQEQARLARLAARTGLIAACCTGLAMLITFGTLGWLLWTGVIALSAGGTAVIAIRTGSTALDNLVRQVNFMYEEALFVGDLDQVSAEATERAIPTGGVPLPEHIESVCFENVTFTYPGDDEPALRGLDLTIPTGKIVALVGRNGCGKSTTVKLLGGLYLPDDGKVVIGGVTTTEADRHDLFSKTKGELLLLVQNSLYAQALERGRTDAENIPDALDAVMAIVRPVVECNRTQVDNGRVYLREMVFGDPAEPHHREALTITGQTEEAVAAVLCRDARFGEGDAATTARVVSAVMFLAMAASVNVAAGVDEILRGIREQIAVLLTR